jgi:hypothetical protein
MTSYALIENPNGTAAAIDTDAVRALVGYTQRLAAEGITWSLGCGCTSRVTCGYHRDQHQRAEGSRKGE